MVEPPPPAPTVWTRGGAGSRERGLDRGTLNARSIRGYRQRVISARVTSGQLIRQDRERDKARDRKRLNQPAPKGRESIRDAIARLDADCPWLVGVEKAMR